MAVDHYENFPVASFLCPPRFRATITAIYRFARTADDIADEGHEAAQRRLQDLDAYAADLRAAFRGEPPSGRWSPVFEGLQRAIKRHQLPSKPLFDLLDAFRQDTGNPLYESRTELLDYCRRSANPVGRLLLHLYRIDDERSLRQSDEICSALQLINFWQDLSVDLPRGRVYVPVADLRARGLSPQHLQDPASELPTRELVEDLCAWSRQMMLAGASLALRVPGRAGWELRLVTQGGLRILDRIAAIGYRTVVHRPTLGATDVPVMAWRSLSMGRVKRP